MVSTATTASNGSYSFTGVGPGNYTIEEQTQSGYLATPPTSFAVTSANGLVASGYNFGEFQKVTLSGEVYNDLNGNGTLDSGETGLSGWTVKLLGSSDQLITTATTDSAGHYAFTGIGPGSYTIQVVPQSGYSSTSATSITVDPTSGQNVTTADFGEIVPVSVGGEVFLDGNGNGVLNSGEPGLSGWTVNLLNSSSQNIGTFKTSTSGDFSFTGVRPGTYTVQLVQQSGYDATTPTSSSITITSGENVPNVNFGEFMPVTVSGEVFDDLTDSGKFVSGDSGLSGWTVKLVQGAQVMQTTSGSGGAFSFSNVGPGSYTLEVVQQTG